MTQCSPTHRRALIVEDEYLFAMSLAVDMQALGFRHLRCSSKLHKTPFCRQWRIRPISS